MPYVPSVAVAIALTPSFLLEAKHNARDDFENIFKLIPDEASMVNRSARLL